MTLLPQLSQLNHLSTLNFRHMRLSGTVPASVLRRCWPFAKDWCAGAVACDGIEQAYLPTPLADPAMDESEVEQLRAHMHAGGKRKVGQVR